MLPCNVSWGNSLVPSAYIAATDVADAIRWLQDHASDYYIDPDQVVVSGHSAGAWTPYTWPSWIWMKLRRSALLRRMA
ncbi:MAG: alpha/beta hydrolase fold domain-containing protein [Saprospirales bacterium]|nr:alpha/beta hydrolase fold domain-containing protein [Saprospirales bacterium]